MLLFCFFLNVAIPRLLIVSLQNVMHFRVALLKAIELMRVCFQCYFRATWDTISYVICFTVINSILGFASAKFPYCFWVYTAVFYYYINIFCMGIIRTLDRNLIILSSGSEFIRMKYPQPVLKVFENECGNQMNLFASGCSAVFMCWTKCFL